MPMRRRMARRTGRRAARRTMRRRAVVAPRRRPVGMTRTRRRRGLGTLLAVGGTAAVAYKLGKNSVQQIEQYSGKPFDELSEDELANSMDDLGIDLPEEDEETAPQAEAPAPQPAYLDELERLAGYRDQGIISDEEFEAKKKQLLGL